MNVLTSVACNDSLLVRTMAKFTIDDTSDEFVFHDIAPINVPLYFSCYIKSEQNGMVLIQGNIVETTSNWKYVEIPCKTSDGNITIRFISNGVYYMKENQLEISTVPSTYAPSTDDYLTEHEVVSKIQQTASEIQLSVSELYYNKVETEALIDIQSNKIDLIVTQIGDFSSDSIISSINLSPESIKISSDKIDIIGFVSIINEDDDTQTNISGNKIRTGVIQSDNYDYTGGSFTNDGFIIDLDNSVIRSKYLKSDENSLEVTGTVNAIGGTFGSVNPFTVSDNGFNGVKIGSTSSDNYSKTLSVPTDSNTVTFQITGSGADTVNDIILKLGTVKLNVQYSYSIGSTTSISGVDDNINDTETEGEGSTTEGGSGSTTGGSVTSYQTVNGSATLTLKTSTTTVTPTVSIINGVKTYSYTYSITSGSLASFVESMVSLPSYYSNFTVTSAITSAVFTYNFSSYTTYSHVGTDYFSYDGLRIEDGVNRFSTPVEIENSLQIKDYLEFTNNGVVYSPRFKIEADTKSLTFSHQPLYDNGSIVFKRYAYGGSYGNIDYTLTLLDNAGNTILPNNLYASYIYPNAKVSGDILNLMAQQVRLEGTELLLGNAYDLHEKRVRFTQNNYSGSYRHDAYLYGGNGDSKTAIGCYNYKDSKCIWLYRDTTDRMYIYNLYFKDWGGVWRKPVSSVSADGKRVQVIGGRSAGLYVYSQWGTSGANLTSKNFNATTSDIRLKENIKPSEISNALDVIDKMQLYSYDWKEYDESLPKHQKIGFIADKLDEIDTRFTVGGGYDKNGAMNLKSIDTLYMLGYVVKGIQEIKERLEKLEKGE